MFSGLALNLTDIKFWDTDLLDTDIPSKNFACLQDVFSVTIFRLPRRLARCLQDVLEDEKLIRWIRVEDVFKTCLKTSLRRLFKTNKCFLGSYFYDILLFVSVIHKPVSLYLIFLPISLSPTSTKQFFTSFVLIWRSFSL